MNNLNPQRTPQKYISTKVSTTAINREKIIQPTFYDLPFLLSEPTEVGIEQ